VQELTVDGVAPNIHFSAHAVELVRGILTTSHVFLKEDVSEKDIWKLYREAYGSEPFVRIVKERDGINRLPEPKMLAGTNLVDIGFEREEGTDRLVVISALDNLTKGSAGAAVQNMNIAMGLPEKTGLDFVGLHPV
jgi:N-acetyl-gamma-glutamyl-phosphate/LysW-gamma-L-alpha-aminoadipyl-6-phosphate reductase